MLIKFKRLHPNAKMPTYAHPGDVGLDLYSCEAYIIKPGERHVFPCGFALEFPEGYGAIVKDKGSLPYHAGLHVMGGVFDAGYRGDYNVLLINLGAENYIIETGQKIAQLVIFPVAIVELEETEKLTATSRGEGKLGSTGKF